MSKITCKVMPLVKKEKLELTKLDIYNVYRYAEAQIVDANLIPENIKKDITILGITGTFERPTLNAPTIINFENTLSIIDPETNGNFVAGYKIYDADDIISVQTDMSYDLSGLQPGSHIITVRAYGNNFNDSQASNEIAVVINE